jgi:hypothetical protein
MMRAESSSAVRELLKGTKYRPIVLNYVEREDKSGPSRPPENFRVTFYDYTNDRTIVAEGDFAGRLPITAREAC